MRIKIASMLLLGATAFTTASAQGVWLEQKHDFGAFDESLGTVYCDFRLVNTGNEPIAIINARANCGCTRPEYSRAPIAPGDTATVRVGFDPTGRPGRFMKYVNVDLDSKPSRASLTIQGTVIGTSNTLKSRFPVAVGPMKLRAKIIPYGEVLKGHTSGQFLEGYNASADTLRPSVTCVPDYMKVLVEPATVPPGDRFVISTILNSDKVDGWGVVTDSMTVAAAPGSPERITVETVAIISEDFSGLSAEERAKAPVIDTDVTALDLERISPTGPEIRRSFTITNKGKSPLIIRRISCPDKAVSVSLKNTEIKPGKSVKAEVTVNPSLLAGSKLLNARINIVANDPDHPSTMIRVVAEVK
ncbi:MAG: DUF1573 domain-containing protein [Duncaniella sp.]|nr:DUF1573 domain-containing protein [Duncaniella sp.]